MRILLNRILLLLPILFLTLACSPQTTPTPFRPPTQSQPTQVIILATTTPIPSFVTIVPTETIAPTVEGPCINALSFLDDITIDDGTSVTPNTAMDKQWLVQNVGTCDWDSTYRLKWIGGDPMGAAQEQPLYPARAGTQATLRILFTAPATDGPYESAWQAYDPEGNPFGDPVFIKIVVVP